MAINPVAVGFSKRLRMRSALTSFSKAAPSATVISSGLLPDGVHRWLAQSSWLRERPTKSRFYGRAVHKARGHRQGLSLHDSPCRGQIEGARPSESPLPAGDGGRRRRAGPAAAARARSAGRPCNWARGDRGRGAERSATLCDQHRVRRHPSSLTHPAAQRALCGGRRAVGSATSFCIQNFPMCNLQRINSDTLLAIVTRTLLVDTLPRPPRWCADQAALASRSRHQRVALPPGCVRAGSPGG